MVPRLLERLRTLWPFLRHIWCSSHLDLLINWNAHASSLKPEMNTLLPLRGLHLSCHRALHLPALLSQQAPCLGCQALVLDDLHQV